MLEQFVKLKTTKMYNFYLYLAIILFMLYTYLNEIDDQPNFTKWF